MTGQSTASAAFDRIAWLPTSLPGGPLTTDLYPLLAITPMFGWNPVRIGRVHEAYVIWALISLPAAGLVHVLCDSAWWHSTARQLIGVQDRPVAPSTRGA